jgi:NNP family nitrate/nitrite transporter-like MFS transporter
MASQPKEAAMATHSGATTAPHSGGSWLARWEPENETFWEQTGKRLAWRTLIVTTFNLILAFMVWFVVSALVVRLPGLGFPLTAGQLF